ncbi:hypothetical protein PgNI_06194 [Pyricularia grisea]|uniref:Uncharacterized protein n=1 Tax=Pyricularia grisea TaxID=148305 RepID=A0A6P8B7M6_PYRGI|nr:hypothetical protein PgNI_06194 [Pyricularia grisea]TLD11243.1 hypothetical protein PgNI_06194 [Pyricularia grisea]
MECVFVFFFVLFIANVVFSTMLAFLMVGVVNTDWGIAPEDNIEEKDLFMLDTRPIVSGRDQRRWWKQGKTEQ